MKPRYNKSEIMKEAHFNKKYSGMTMSEALKRAWSVAKFYVLKDEESEKEIRIDNEIKEFQKKNTRVSNMNYLANTLNNSYNRGSSAYYGD